MAKVVKVGPFGGSGGDVFDMGAACQLLEIKIRHAGVIDAITIIYLVNGRIESKRFGGGGGTREGKITFQPGEYLVEISGTVGDGVFDDCITVVTSLKFRTNLGNNYGPYGTEQGTCFSVPVLNAKIVGFFGRSGGLVDAIGVNIVPTCCGPICGPKC